MDVVGNLLKAVRESLFVRIKEAQLVSTSILPAIIDENVLKAGIMQPSIQNKLCLLHNFVSCHLLAPEGVPG